MRLSYSEFCKNNSNVQTKNNVKNIFQAVSLGIIFFTLVGCGEDSNDKGGDKSKVGFESVRDTNEGIDSSSCGALNSGNDYSGDDYSSRVIYGDDNRQDLYEVKESALLSLADSTAALVYYRDLTVDGSMTNIKTAKYANSFRLPLCQTEKFVEQDTAAFCSGFLIAPNIMVTAGHCVQTQSTPSSDCTTTKFVFGFNVAAKGVQVNRVPTSEVYSCKRIIKQTLVNNGADFSIIELDRPVLNHKPLKLRSSGSLAVNDPLVVIGHPSGLPTKVSGCAKVRTLFPAFIRANLDTYGGNSGSAVFNAVTKEVEGVLVRGETDFVVGEGNCMTSKRCADDECRGEDVTKASELLPFIP